MSDDPLRQPIAWLANAYDKRRLSAVEVTIAVLERIAAIDDELRSYLALTAATALEEARQAERELAQGRRRGPLHGVPVAVKDLIDVAGMVTSGGSASRSAEAQDADANLVRELRAGGAVVIGKNNLYEFGLGLPMPGEWPVPSRNPWNPARIPGGSSSGSAVAVAAGMCAGSFGTDTGGSIRGPAAYCGVVGMKPTYDLISRRGVLALSWTLDHVGPLGRTVDDVAALLEVAGGRAVTLGDSIEGLRVGVPESLVASVEMEPDVAGAFEAAVGVMGRAGADVRPVELPENELTEAALLAIIGSEGLAAHLPALADRPEKFGASARERLTAGLAYTGTDYVNALRMRDFVAAQMSDLYRAVDVLMSPVTLQVAPTKEAFERDPPHRTPFTGLHNLVGGPAVSVPGGLDSAGMPIGLQLAGPPGGDALVLTAARAFERATGWHEHFPADRWAVPAARRAGEHAQPG